MCENCNNDRKQEFDYSTTEIDLRLQYKADTKGLDITYEQWLEERCLGQINESRIIRKANNEIQQVIIDEIGTEGFLE